VHNFEYVDPEKNKKNVLIVVLVYIKS